MDKDGAYIMNTLAENTIEEPEENKTEVKIGIRSEGYIEILSGLEVGNIIVAEGLRKVIPRGKIKPIEKGSEKDASNWKKKDKKENN